MTEVMLATLVFGLGVFSIGLLAAVGLRSTRSHRTTPGEVSRRSSHGYERSL
ncbi:MAG: hypothetical protein ACRD5M_12240 [Candidatus Acidiferrales bacterium]